MEKICVAVRVRPPVKSDEDSNSNCSHWKVDDNRISLHRSLSGTPLPPALSYAFDHVFDQNCSNSSVYDLLTKDIIHAVVDGFNGTAFAYGQTSSGKTFTMNGSENDPGIIHRAVKDIFAKIDMSTDREFLIRVSYMEIYNEEINDLFAVENQKLQIHESLERGIFVAGLREEIVNNAEQVLKLIEMGEVNRHFGETNMNVRSSRSHTIFRMVIESKGKDSTNLDDAIRVSVLNLVDLAGSERIAKTGAGGVRLKEGKHINKSLMILGNVINKLSEGAKQRGHIPYRDSKLTRILQPALGGNAKTSIICTVAPEEVHVEETKGTLQFASRAKRITNCVQVNEILTDAALLKRQKMEIEELRMKLEGSHAGVLEQEILKLRNDMLKYELEREKLAMELEEERKSHREREQCSNGISSQNGESLRKNLKEEASSTQQGDAFSTPTFKPIPNSFVAKRCYNSTTPVYSPLPDAFGDVVDEDTWFKMNNGFIADLDSIRMTPPKQLSSIPSFDKIQLQDSSIDNYKEVENLRKQLQQAIDERNEFEKQHKEQVALNNQLMEEISKLQEIPQKLSESLGNCKAVNEEIFSTFKGFAEDEKSATANLFSKTSEFVMSLMSSFEAQIYMAMNGFRKADDEKESSYSEESKKKYKDCTLETQITCWKKEMSDEIKLIKERYENLEEELDMNNQLLEASKARIHGLQKESQVLSEERDDLLVTVSDSWKRSASLNEQNEKILQDLTCEIQKRKDLEDDIKQFSVGFVSRYKSYKLFSSEIKSKVEHLKAQKPFALIS
ncbi:kinesin-like protein KIN-7N isoform X1 [Lactuca sativa]|uniref:kinesin-like protein KIN-7N isoform X1 n=1 Tax=Lactuca sativa TaxID=4236 RepID=UPI000CD84A9A|nr:kinesin-like protein KIN-7N isoform X1 [Lactuca sativa]